LIYNYSDFTFKAPSVLSRARRILIKPMAGYPVSYPVTTSREMMATIIKGIRKVTDADILILDGTPDGGPISPIFRSLGYDFPRIITLDVNDCVWVEVDNPLTKPLAVPTFWIPNVVLSSDYLISVSPLKVVNGFGHLSIMNLLSLLPSKKYGNSAKGGWEELYSLGIEKVIADLYFTMPFDLAIVEARQKFITSNEPAKGEIEEYGKIFMGDLYKVDVEISQTLGIKTNYLDLIKEAMVEFSP
jgi:uncharacterized protein (DUF362 family)